MALRVMNLLTDLFFCNGYCVNYKAKKDSNNQKICREGGWAESSKNSSAATKKRRSNVSHKTLFNSKDIRMSSAIPLCRGQNPSKKKLANLAFDFLSPDLLVKRIPFLFSSFPDHFLSRKRNPPLQCLYFQKL